MYSLRWQCWSDETVCHVLADTQPSHGEVAPASGRRVTLAGSMLEQWTEEQDGALFAHRLQGYQGVSHLALGTPGLSFTPHPRLLSSLLTQLSRPGCSLTELKVSGPLLNGDQLDSLARALGQAHGGFQHAALWKIPLGSNGATLLALSMASKGGSAGTLQGLDLFCCDVGDRGARAIAALLSKCTTTLRHLDLLGNCITSSGVTTLVESLATNRRVTYLGLSDNPIGEAGILAIADLLQVNHTLRELALSGVRVGERSMGRLAAALAANATVTQLDLGWNHLSTRSITSLSSLLSNTTCAITTLDLVGNALHGESARVLATALETSTSLRSLNLTCTELTEADVYPLATALAVNTTLQTLNLMGNNLGVQGGRLLAVVLEVNTSLVELFLVSTGQTTDSASAFARSLDVNETLATLDLDRNAVDDATLTAIATTLSHRPVRPRHLRPPTGGAPAGTGTPVLEQPGGASSVALDHVARAVSVALAHPCLRADSAEARMEDEHRLAEAAAHLEPLADVRAVVRDATRDRTALRLASAAVRHAPNHGVVARHSAAVDTLLSHRPRLDAAADIVRDVWQGGNDVDVDASLWDFVTDADADKRRQDLASLVGRVNVWRRAMRAGAADAARRVAAARTSYAQLLATVRDVGPTVVSNVLHAGYRLVMTVEAIATESRAPSPLRSAGLDAATVIAHLRADAATTVAALASLRTDLAALADATPTCPSTTTLAAAEATARAARHRLGRLEVDLQYAQEDGDEVAADNLRDGVAKARASVAVADNSRNVEWARLACAAATRWPSLRRRLGGCATTAGSLDEYRLQEPLSMRAVQRRSTRRRATAADGARVALKLFRLAEADEAARFLRATQVVATLPPSASQHTVAVRTAFVDVEGGSVVGVLELPFHEHGWPALLRPPPS
uniref:Protein kinase domain-containing protein n=1 Tax=Sexangularia sp. CB-2014 TaxID=1486929 RepID=A0A7S1V8F8_9EUKA